MGKCLVNGHFRSRGVAEVEKWLASLDVKPSSRRKALVVLHGIFQRARKVYGLAQNPVSEVEKPPLTRSGDIDVFSPEEVFALAPRRRVSTRRRHLPYGRVHRPAPRRAARAALARHLLHRRGHPGARDLQRRVADHPQVRQDPLGPARARRGGDALASGFASA